MIVMLQMFNDTNASNGMNYYRLKQVDLDGNAKEYGPVFVNIQTSRPKLSIYSSDNTLEILLHSDQTDFTKVSVLDINGRSIKRTSFNTAKGSNHLTLPVALIPGVYVVWLKSRSSAPIREKLIIQ